MTCPMCDGSTKIIDTRKNSDHVVRYRRCSSCGYKFPTIEVDEDIYHRRKKSNADSDKKMKKFVEALREITGKLNDLGDKYD